MDNYLSPRWPKGPGVQPPPVPTPAPPAPPRRRWSPRRWTVTIVCIVLAVALLAGVSFWAVNGLAELLAGMEFPDPSVSQPPRHSWTIPDLRPGVDWTPDDLPWGEPDPSVSLSVEAPGETVLSGRDIHQRVLPSLVYVEAAEKGSHGRITHAGTGVIVTASGYVITNYHIIEDSDRVGVMPLARQGELLDAKVIGFDAEFDIAVLKFAGEGLDLTPARLGDSDALAVGDQVYAEGNPMGYLLGSMTEGIVSALNRDDEVDGKGMGMIQTSAALNPGNSGGALVNGAGQVVGITSAKITGLVREEGDAVEDAAVLENIGLALPMSDILPFVNRILATGASWRPYIGITCEASRQGGRQGILVATVEDGVPAQEAGLRKGDLIVSANGAAVATLPELRRQIYRTGVDSELHCIVVRDGAELPISFALIDKPTETE